MCIPTAYIELYQLLSVHPFPHALLAAPLLAFDDRDQLPHLVICELIDEPPAVSNPMSAVVTKVTATALREYSRKQSSRPLLVPPRSPYPMYVSDTVVSNNGKPMVRLAADGPFLRVNSLS